MIRRLQCSDKDKTHLSSLAIDPSSQADDFFDYSTVLIRKPWGHEYLIFKNDQAAVWNLFLKHDAKTSMHCHPNKKTGLVLLAGEAEVLTLNASHIINAGQGFVIEKGVFHSTKALSPEGIVVMEIETPVNKNDLVRLHDEYGRGGKGYEGKDHHVPLKEHMCHFHQERYNCGKKFGNCMLTVARCADAYTLQCALTETGADIAVLVHGNIYNSAKERIVEMGDALNVRELASYERMHLPEEVELLLIRKET